MASDQSSNSSETVSDPWATVSAPEVETTSSDPWATATEAPVELDPWGTPVESTPTQSEPVSNGSMDFLSAGEEQINNSISDPFAEALIPLDHWVDVSIDWIVTQFRPAFTAVKTPIDATLNAIDTLLNSIHPFVFIVVFALIAWQFAGRKLAVISLIGFTFIGLIGVWPETMTTLSLVLTSVFFCLLIGLPAGIVMARSRIAKMILRPILDAMQTTPAFVYLVPIVMLFGIGNVPGVVVTIIFAVPPVIRLTSLGIEQVAEDLIEASRAFGASERQLLFKVQLPLAAPTIMAGVNQTLMLALSMVVIASMISVGGLGLMVLRGIGRLDIGLATLGGIGIVVLAIILDRLTQAFATASRERKARHWYQSGPIGLFTQFTLYFKTRGQHEKND